jgi:hypothetical protein
MMHDYYPKDLIGRTFLKDVEENGQRFQAPVVQAIVDREMEWTKVMST